VSARGPSVLVKPTAGPDEGTTRALDDIRKLALGHDELLDGAQLIEDVTLLTASFKRIKHGLKRRPRGYFVARMKSAPGAAFVLYDDNENRTDARQFLYLRTVGADVTVDLVVF
jgi:hypothetical protein